MELDHIFLIVPDRDAARRMLDDAGLVANYSRHHTGQGTSNLCACLDDMYIELLWFDGSPISSETENISLALRQPSDSNCQIGVSWRGDCNVDKINYMAPFGLTVPVLRASQNPALPFVFQSPGTKPPDEQSDPRYAERQYPRFSSLKICRIGLEVRSGIDVILNNFTKIEVEHTDREFIEFEIHRADDTQTQIIRWYSRRQSPGE